MRKIPTVFLRDQNTHHITLEVNPCCQWVLDGEGVATEKFDGVAVLVEGGRYFTRRTLRRGEPAPEGFRPAQEEPNPITGDLPGWMPAQEMPFYKCLQEALTVDTTFPEDGTYELVGPKINKNPHGFSAHFLWLHGAIKLHVLPRTRPELRDFLEQTRMEGIVWHHPDGRRAKLKRRDFGFPWPIKAADGRNG